MDYESKNTSTLTHLSMNVGCMNGNVFGPLVTFGSEIQKGLKTSDAGIANRKKNHTSLAITHANPGPDP